MAHVLYEQVFHLSGFNLLHHLQKSGTVKASTANAVIREMGRVGKVMLGSIIFQQFLLRRDLSRSVFAMQCTIRIDKQQKEGYNNIVIDNGIIV